MINPGKYKFIPLIIFALAFSINGQSKRGLNNDGVDLYEQKKYAESEVLFKKSLEKDPNMFEGHFNLADSYYKQGRFDEAIQSYKNSLSFTEDKGNKSKAYHNLGNSFVKGQKYKEAVQAYANALKNNPDDLETKYNLSYALNMMKQNQQQNKDNKDQNKKDQNKDQQQNQDQQKNQDKKDKEDKKDQQQPQPQPQKQKDEISKEEAQRILEAMKNNEKDLQKKLRKVKGKPVATEKDW
jgi:Ca-activated chloride channel homolog